MRRRTHSLGGPCLTDCLDYLENICLQELSFFKKKKKKKTVNSKENILIELTHWPSPTALQWCDVSSGQERVDQEAQTSQGLF